MPYVHAPLRLVAGAVCACAATSLMSVCQDIQTTEGGKAHTAADYAAIQSHMAPSGAAKDAHIGQAS